MNQEEESTMSPACPRKVGPLAGAVVVTLLAGPALADPLSAGGFLENVGQYDEEVLFSASVSGTAIYFTQEGLVLDIAEPDIDAVIGPDESVAWPHSASRRGCAVHIRFDNANPDPRVEGSGELCGRFHFFRGSDPSAWHTGAQRVAEVVYRHVWPGIDLAFRLAPGKLTYDAIVHPQADPSRIRFSYEGADRVIAEAGGDHRIETSVRTFIHRLPGQGERTGAIVCGGGSEAVSERTDFTVWITLLGGSGADACRASALDGQGRPVVAGITDSGDFPKTAGAYQDSVAGDFDAFIAKLSCNGDSLLWATFLGGTDFERSDDVILDSAGNILTTGETYSQDFPTTPGAFDPTASTGGDAFVAKVSSDGDSLLWSTYLAAEALDRGWGLALDSTANVVVTGYTESDSFPTTPGAYDETHNGPGVFDVFVSKLASTGHQLIWSTLLGGVDYDRSWGIMMDSQDHPIVCGHTRSPEFPTTPGVYQENHHGGADGFVTKLSADADSLLWSSFLGGTDWDRLTGVVIDDTGNLIVGGWTTSSDFPTTVGAYDRTFNGAFDAFVAALGPTAESLHWGTYVGGSANDCSMDLEIGPGGSLVTAGSTWSSDFPTTPDAFDPTYNGNSDGFAIVLSASGSSLLYGSYFGGSGVPWPDEYEGFAFSNPVTVDSSGDVILAGLTWSDDFPTTEGAWDREFNGAADAVVLKMTLSTAVAAPDLTERIPGDLQLACSPNPFRDGTTIVYTLPTMRSVRVGMYDVAGRLVRVLQAAESLPAGEHRLTWDGLDAVGSPVSAGVYFVRVETPRHRESQRVVMLR